MSQDAIEILGGDAAIAPDEAVVMMTAEEAREVCDDINSHLQSARKQLLELHRREGWKALGYENFRECAVAQFGGQSSYIYRLLSAARIEEALDLPIGEMPESHARELAKAPPEKRREVLDVAKGAAGGKVTATAIKEARESVGSPIKAGSIVVLKGQPDRRGIVLESLENGDISIAFSNDPQIIPTVADQGEVMVVRGPTTFEVNGLVQTPEGVGVYLGRVSQDDGTWESILINNHHKLFSPIDLDPYVWSAGSPEDWKDLSGVTHVKLNPYSKFRDELFKVAGEADDPRFVTLLGEDGQVFWHLRGWITQTVTQGDLMQPSETEDEELVIEVNQALSVHVTLSRDLLMQCKDQDTLQNLLIVISNAAQADIARQVQLIEEGDRDDN